MKKLIYVFLLMVLASLASCGRNSQTKDYTEHTPPEEEIFEIPEPAQILPVEIPSFDHYEISITIEPSTRTVTNGISRITFTNRTGEPLDTIVLRVFPNAINEDYWPYFAEHERLIFRRGRDFGFMHIEYVSMDSEDLEYELIGTVLSLRPKEPIVPEQTVQFTLQYSAVVPMIAHRTGANDHAIWFGMFLPLLAVHGEGMWLVYDYYPVGDPFILGIASFDVEIITPAGYIVAGTGIKTDERIIEDSDIRITSFTANNSRDFAFAISSYFHHEWISTEVGDIHLYYYTEGLPIDIIMEIISTSMEYFTNRIGRYPFDHIRIVETDMFRDSMVFSNMIFIDSAALKLPNYRVLSHALGHQWFSNVVGSNPVTEPWLDKGLVRYVQAGLFYRQPATLRSHITEEHARIAMRDDLYLSHGLWAFESWRDYYETHHIKGMLMFGALNYRLGDILFWELIRQYFQTYYFQIATGADFFRLAEEVYDGSLEDFLTKWFSDGTVPTMPWDVREDLIYYE